MANSLNDDLPLMDSIKNQIGAFSKWDHPFAVIFRKPLDGSACGRSGLEDLKTGADRPDSARRSIRALQSKKIA